MEKLWRRILATTGRVAVMASMAACSTKPGIQTESAQTKAAARTETTVQTKTSAQAETEGDKMTVNHGNMEDVSTEMELIELTNEQDKVSPLSGEVNHREIVFVDHFGITPVVGLYEPREYTGRLPVITVCGPSGAVKEQSSGLYAQELAKGEFLAISFSPSSAGESAGYPRDFSSPDINTEDYQAAVDFPSTRENVDPEKIGIIGTYGWGGTAVQTAALDTRIKATAAITTYDVSRNTTLGYFDSMDEEGRCEVRAVYNHQRTEDYKNGFYTMGGGLPEGAPEEVPQYVKDYIAYHKAERGYYPRSVNANNGWAATTSSSLTNMRLLEYAPEIHGAALLVYGEEAHSPMYSQEAYRLLRGDNKELMITPGASYIDLYDQMDIILLDKLETFFHDASARQLRTMQEAVNPKE